MLGQDQAVYKQMLVTILFLFQLFIFSNAFALTDCKHDNDNFRCVEYIKNYDGDTITFNIPNIHPLLGKKISIRINGIDTPEIRTKNKHEKKKALKAKMIVQSILEKANRIDLMNIKRGKYFRIVADVIIDNASLGDKLIKIGIAKRYSIK